MHNRSVRSVCCPFSWLALESNWIKSRYTMQGLDLGLVSEKDIWWLSDKRETDAELIARANHFLERVYASVSEKVIFVVTHSGFLSAVLEAVGREPYSATNSELVPVLVTKNKVTTMTWERNRAITESPVWLNGSCQSYTSIMFNHIKPYVIVLVRMIILTDHWKCWKSLITRSKGKSNANLHYCWFLITAFHVSPLSLCIVCCAPQRCEIWMESAWDTKTITTSNKWAVSWVGSE